MSSFFYRFFDKLLTDFRGKKSKSRQSRRVRGFIRPDLPRQYFRVEDFLYFTRYHFVFYRPDCLSAYQFGCAVYRRRYGCTGGRYFGASSARQFALKKNPEFMRVHNFGISFVFLRNYQTVITSFSFTSSSFSTLA